MRLPAMRGFTLIELMISVAVLGVLLAIAAPSFNNFFDKYRVKRAADTFSSFLINAKSEAIKRNKSVVTVITGNGATWCAGMTEAATCNCTSTTTGACQIDGVARVIASTAFTGVTLLGPTTDTTTPYVFEFKTNRGTITGGNNSVQLQSAAGLKLNVVVGQFGRIRLCSPDGSISGYPTSC